MCQFFGVSRAAYYTWVNRLTQADPDQDRMELVQEAYRKSRRTYAIDGLLCGFAKTRGFSSITRRF